MAATVAVHVDTCAQKSRQKEVKDTICLLSVCSVDRGLLCIRAFGAVFS